MILRARFVRCARCSRLLVIDCLNPRGRCVATCGHLGTPPRCFCGESPCAVQGAVHGWKGITEWARHISPYLE